MPPDAKRRALVIASPTGALRGPRNDAALVAHLLQERGFEVRSVVGRHATRAGILEGYESLIEDTRAGDAAVVYFSGHGGVRRGAQAEFRYVVPVDIADTAADDFRGVLEEELSVLQWRLTMRTRNVTTLWDCCFSGRMSRGALPGRMTVRGVEEEWPQTALLRRRAAAAAEFERLRRAHPEEPWFDANPHAVRMRACSPNEEAYEGYSFEFGGHLGFFTAALVSCLRADPGGTWQAVGEQVRHRVVARSAAQRPEAAGPTGRVVFTEELRPAHRSHPVRIDARSGLAWLDGAALHGFEVGDEFLLGLLGRPFDPGRAALAVVTAVHGDAARLAAANGGPLADGLEAHPLRSARRAHRVRVECADAERRARFVRQLAGIPDVRVAEEEQPGGEIATITLEETGFLLRDAARLPLYPAPRTADPASIARLREDIAHLGNAVRLRELVPGADRLTVPVSFTASLVGGTADLSVGAPVVHGGDRIRLRVRNGADGGRPVYANVLDLGVAGRISVLNVAEPSGIELLPGQERAIGADPGGYEPGLPLTWPALLPVDSPRFETLVAVFSDQPQDLRGLAQPGVSHRSRQSPVGRELAWLLRPYRRDLAGPSLPAVRYAFVHVPFVLCPGGLNCTHRATPGARREEQTRTGQDA
ncbi:caspase family protein [Actinomadura keratinilytica]|uniref:caspase family protein n=2 Tax=Actinomadura keratinilytica TaxID=547461 RepID=UPI00362390DF